MIIVKLRGGLGNQMFQYACARNLQMLLGQELILDVSDFSKDSQRSFSLGNFLLTTNIRIEESPKYNSKYDRRTNQLLRVITKIMPDISYSVLSKRGIYVYEGIKYKAIIVSSKSENIYLNGYWQSLKYFKDIENIIRTEFSVCKKIKPNNLKILEKIQKTNSVCVHIRRGDYLNPINHLCVCNENYYFEAIKLAEKYLHNPTFFIFSDDIENVKNAFGFLNYKNVIFVSENNLDYEEIQLMSACKNFIITNSSFSWWAQYLGNNKEKLVIAPDVWYTDGRETAIFMDTWKLIHCEV